MSRIPNFKIRKRGIFRKVIDRFWFLLLDFKLPNFLTKNKNRYVFIGLVCLASAFIFINQCQASANDTPFSGTGTITAGSNQMLGCTIMVAQDYTPTVTWNSEVMTMVPSYEYQKPDNHSGQFAWSYHETSDFFFYLVNPSLGTSTTISITGDGGFHDSSCQVFENVSPTNPIFATSSPFTYVPLYTTSMDYSTSQGDSATQVVVPFAVSADPASYASSWKHAPTIHNTNGYGYYTLLSAITADGFPTVTLPQSGQNLQGFFIQLRSQTSPTCTSWQYNNWGQCVYGYQSRAITDSFPAGCTGGDPFTYQSCDNTNPYQYGDLSFNTPYQCSINFSCAVQYVYDPAVFTTGDYIDIYKSTGEFVASSTIIDESNNKKQSGSSYFEVSSASSTTSNYNIIGHKGTATTSEYQIVVYFPSEPVLQNYLDTLYPEANICDGLDLTTNGFGWPNSFTDTFQCMGKKVIRWAFQPDVSIINNLSNTYKTFQQVFPFSIYYGITNAVTSGINSQTLTLNNNFSVPMIRKTGTSTEYYMVPVVSSSTMGRAIGTTNALLVRNTISWVMWLCVAGGLFMQFKKI